MEGTHSLHTARLFSERWRGSAENSDLMCFDLNFGFAGVQRELKQQQQIGKDSAQIEALTKQLAV